MGAGAIMVSAAVLPFALGAAWLFERTRSLLAPIVAHSVFNAVATLLTLTA